MEVASRRDAETRQLIVGLENVLDAFRQYSGRNPWCPTQGSPLRARQAELARESGPSGQWECTPATIAGDSAQALLIASCEYLRGASALLNANCETFALAPVIRAAVEALGRVGWILDPTTLSAREFAARVKLLWLDDFRQVRTSMTSNADAKTARTSQQDAEESIHTGFFPAEIVQPEANSDGFIPMPTVSGQTVPGLRATVRYLEDPSGGSPNYGKLYDVLSTLSHPTLTPILQVLRASPGEAIETPIAFTRLLVGGATIGLINMWMLTAGFFGMPLINAASLSHPFGDPQTDSRPQ